MTMMMKMLMMFVFFLTAHLHFPIVQVCKGDGENIADDVHDDARDNGAENDDTAGVITMTMIMKMLMMFVFFLALHLHFPIVLACAFISFAIRLIAPIYTILSTK